MAFDITDLPIGPRLKIQRAQHHIHDLDRQVDAYLAKRPMKLIIRQRRKPPTKTMEIEINDPVPDEFALILGDAVHNLRAALDLFAFHLIGHLVESEQAVHFPFAWKPERVRETIRSRQIHLAGEHIVTAIEKLEFHLGGNRLLSGLHLLDITDKHKIIPAVGRAAQLTADEVAINIPETGFVGPGVLHFAYQDDPELIRIDLTGDRATRRAMPEFKREAEVQPVFAICFGPDTPFAGGIVVPTLIDIANEVVRAVRNVMAAKPV